MRLGSLRLSSNFLMHLLVSIHQYLLSSTQLQFLLSWLHHTLLISWLILHAQQPKLRLLMQLHRIRVLRLISPLNRMSPPETPESSCHRYLGDLIPKDAVMPTPPSVHVEPASTSQGFSVMHILRKPKDPPPLDLNLPVVRTDESQPIHRLRRRKRRLREMQRELAQPAPVHVSHQPNITTSVSTPSLPRAIQELVDQARDIDTDSITVEEENTRRAILDRARARARTRGDTEIDLAMFDRMTQGRILDRFYRWANSSESSDTIKDKATSPPRPLHDISKHTRRAFQLARSRYYTKIKRWIEKTVYVSQLWA